MAPLERAAEAAKKALLEDPETDAYMRADDDVEEFLIDGRVDLTRVVRAVLEAVREPDDFMIRAGIIERHEGDVPEAWSKATANIYTAMIAAVLSE